MSRVLADSALKDAIAKNGQRLELCDESGQVIGYVLTPEQMRKFEMDRQSLASVYALADETFDLEVYRKTLADPRKYTAEEAMKKLGLA